MNHHKHFIDSAISLAAQSMQKYQGGPFGAVVVKDQIIIGRGYNQVTQHNDPTAHAEINAIRDACQNISDFSLSGCTLYSSSEPCPMCLSAIYWARLDEVIYANNYQQAQAIGFDDQFIFQQLKLANAEKKIPIVQTAEIQSLKKAAQVFSDWDKSIHKQSY